ncbi:cyclin-dependent kinase inhibitor 3 family protein [Thioalkalivibrio sp. ALJ16]|uniref:cyclin-dependent kinase inhibitor 3 family protein n=1 Tax=Thioalkalivibrio sp. ALJ16 TaxID=1158762 RepID=UPI0003733726|nr:cyclin-dependent kinase inhibitor 3 family protein [Thioalkalivibrio sp. ALJ16]
MTDSRPSQPHTLKIGTLKPISGGTLGMTRCPGTELDRPAAERGTGDLHADLAAIRDWGATTLVTLNPPQELEALGVPELGAAAAAAGLNWLHLPIGDMAAPDRPWESLWQRIGPVIHARLEAGEGVVFHCGGGQGRAGTIAALTLSERDHLDPEEAIRQVRAARPGAIESPDQQRYLKGRRL